jgi:hypothetical protein
VLKTHVLSSCGYISSPCMAGWMSLILRTTRSERRAKRVRVMRTLVSLLAPDSGGAL